MKKKFLVAACLLITAVAMAGEVQFSRSGVRDMLIRVSGDERYLLIPIEEAAPEYRMQVIENGRIVRTNILRLAAKGKVDYFVPMDLTEFRRDQLLLAVHVWNQPDGERQRELSPMDYIAWSEMTLSDTFDTANRDPYRPEYHHTPLYGWMNDPNGMFYRDGVWHLYYQYNPYCSLWQNMSWGHSTSTDLIHWEHQPIALQPDVIGTIFSGSAVIDHEGTAGFGEGAVVAMYTSAELMGQCQSLAYSTDNGQTFTKYSGNPIITEAIPDFRDPNFFWNEDTREWNLVLASGQEMRFYASADLKHWRYLSSFGSDYGCHSGVWECPDLFPLKDEQGNTYWVLICNINPGGPAGGSAAQYFIGQWDGHTFTCHHTDTRWMDYGKDHYATVSFSDAPDGRRTVLGWMSNWQYANQVPTRQFRSANTIARDLFLYTVKGQHYLGSRPAPEYDGKGLDQVVKIKSQSKPTVVTLSNEQGEEFLITYDPKAMTLSVDRSKSGVVDFSVDFPVPATAPVQRKLTSLRIFIDRCSVEVFGNNGEVCLTSLVFPQSKLKL
ncbi:MAG: DUF4980 domain-containing protein [Paludibacteraceae bacterium]